MIILIAGSTHTGKTNLAQKLLEKYNYPYLSLDHLKMGLIRSGQTKLTPFDDKLLTPYLWNIAKEIVKTAVENKQNMIIEGCYIPFNWRSDFSKEYLTEIKYICLIMSEDYIRSHFEDIRRCADVIERRPDDSDLNMEELIRDNSRHFEMCRKYSLSYVYIDESYHVNDIVIQSGL